jgi:hypothetical protein
MRSEADPNVTESQSSADEEHSQSPTDAKAVVKELGGPKGKEPTRYGDWEKNGRCIDF